MNQGDIYFGDLGKDGIGSELMGVRPLLIISNNIINKYAATITVAYLTAQISEPKLPTHVKVDRLRDVDSELFKDYIIMLEQVRTIDKKELVPR